MSWTLGKQRIVENSANLLLPSLPLSVSHSLSLSLSLSLEHFLPPYYGHISQHCMASTSMVTHLIRYTIQLSLFTAP